MNPQPREQIADELLAEATRESTYKEGFADGIRCAYEELLDRLIKEKKGLLE